MGTRADHQITPMLSVRYDYHGGVADRFGPVSITMERHPDGNERETASFLLRTELTRGEAAALAGHLAAAMAAWDERERSEDENAG